MASFEFDEPSPNPYGMPADRAFDQFEGEGALGGGEGLQQPLEGTYVPPPPANGMLDDDFVGSGATLPPPSQMEAEESFLLREWRTKRAEELEQKAKVSREKHAQIVENAKHEAAEFYKKREASMAQAKINNREKEQAFMANLQSLNAKAGGNYWENVTSFITFDVTAGKKDKSKVSKESGGPQRTSQLLADTKPGKHTDKARMRQVLLKLKHSPPVRAAT